jgi:hypothetical protein
MIHVESAPGLQAAQSARRPLLPRRAIAGFWVGLMLIAPSGPLGAQNTSRWMIHQSPNPRASPAYQWLDIMQEASAREVERNGARPTIISRNMAIVVTAMYDAWSAYDAKAVGTRLGGRLRRPAAERTNSNKAKAIAYGTYRALLFVHPEDAEWIRAAMRGAGHDPDDASTDPSTPQGIGNLAAQAVAEFRKRDGANQFADEAGSGARPYSDYTGYAPINPGVEIKDPDRWQPIPFSDGKGGTFSPGFLTPHWYKVRPLVLDRSDMFRPGPPPVVGSAQLKKEIDEVIAFNASLSMEQRAIVEFMRDGPRSTGQSGHWLRFAQDVSRRDRYGIDQDVKLFFAVAGVSFDAFIACWEAKRFYDSSRPWTLVRHYYKGQTIKGWAGPGKGVLTDLPAEKWHPYSPDTFVTPPFPGYPSGHSTVSAAASTILALFTGSDRLEVVCQHEGGALTGEAGIPPQKILGVDGKSASDGVMTAKVSLSCPTFSATAEMAGLSRIMGGYHIQADNVVGLALGRQVAQYSWPRYQALFEGTMRDAAEHDSMAQRR